MQTVRKPSFFHRCSGGCGRPGSCWDVQDEPQTRSSSRCSRSEEWDFSRIFAPFFALRPAGRECPFFSPRALTAVSHRGLGGLFFRNALFDSGYMLCDSSRLLVDVLTHFLCADGTSDPEVDFVLLFGVSWYGEVCTVDASVVRWWHVEIWTPLHEPPPSGSHLFAVRAFPHKGFLSPRWLTAVSCRGLGGDGDAGSSLLGVLSP